MPARATLTRWPYSALPSEFFFLIFGQYKVFGTEFTLHGGFQFWINKFLEGGVYPFMAPVLRGFVLPHATAFAFLTAYGELAIGLGLVIGFWVRSGERRGTALDAGIALFVGLSGSARRLLAILRREPEPFGVRALFRCVSGGPRGLLFGRLGMSAEDSLPRSAHLRHNPPAPLHPYWIRMRGRIQ